MADTRPTKLNLLFKCYLCFLAIFAPARFIIEEKRDDEKRKSFPKQEEREHKVFIVRRAFWNSLLLIVMFGGMGCLAGFFLKAMLGEPSKNVISVIQVVGASLLLWGTLFVRGWEIQTYCGVTLGERVNQWLYRGLYCVGTSIVVASLVWAG